MSGYPHNQSGQGYGYGGAPPPGQPYGAPPPYGAPQPGHQSPYGAPPSGHQLPYGAPPSGHQPSYGAPPSGHQPSYGGHQPSYGAPEATPYGAPSAPHAPEKPPKENKPYGAPPASSYPPSGSYGSPPSPFPPGTHPDVVACFQNADRDGSGKISDKVLQRILSPSLEYSLRLRTVHLLMNEFTNTDSRKIGPKEFTPLFYSLQNWTTIFERFDRDRSGKIDQSELREALLNLGFAVSPVVLDVQVSKFDKAGGKSKAIDYDNFIECCLNVKRINTTDLWKTLV